MFFVYAITYSGDSNVVYIGKTNNPIGRWKDHRASTSGNSQYHLHRAMRKHGIENFEFNVLTSHVSEENAYDFERFLVVEAKQRNFHVLNMTEGGRGVLGRQHDVETRQRISDTMKNRKLSIEHRENLRKNHARACAKLSDEQVIEIRRRHSEGESMKKLEKEFQHTGIKQIVRKITYRHIL